MLFSIFSSVFLFITLYGVMSYSFFVSMFKWGSFSCDGKGTGQGDFPASWSKSFPTVPRRTSAWSQCISGFLSQSLLWFREVLCLHPCVYQGPKDLTFWDSALILGYISCPIFPRICFLWAPFSLNPTFVVFCSIFILFLSLVTQSEA